MEDRCRSMSVALVCVCVHCALRVAPSVCETEVQRRLCVADSSTMADMFLPHD